MQKCICRNGLEDVIGLDWLRMFSYRELETLISGAEHAISVEDLQANTNYSGGYTADHPTIKGFLSFFLKCLFRSFLIIDVLYKTYE